MFQHIQTNASGVNPPQLTINLFSSLVQVSPQIEKLSLNLLSLHIRAILQIVSFSFMIHRANRFRNLFLSYFLGLWIKSRFSHDLQQIIKIETTPAIKTSRLNLRFSRPERNGKLLLLGLWLSSCACPHLWEDHKDMRNSYKKQELCLVFFASKNGFQGPHYQNRRSVTRKHLYPGQTLMKLKSGSLSQV